MATRSILAGVAFSAVFVAAACGARSTLDVGGEPRGQGGRPVEPAGSGGLGGGVGGMGGVGGNVAGQGGEGGQGGFGGGPGECVVFNSVAALAPADLFMMLDSSGSMAFGLQNGGTKWDAVSDALGTFFAASESKGMDASLAFFPIVDTSVAPYCTSDAQCGEPESCFPRKVCPNALVTCFDDGDCANLGFPQDTCQVLGRCTSQGGQPFCVASGDGGLSCSTGPCTPTGGCDNRFTCDEDAYETSQSGLVSLPQGANTLTNILAARPLTGGTPSLPALEGVIAAAVANGEVNPSHKTFVLFVTDGFPTVCDPDLYGPDPILPIQNLAAVAAAGFGQGIPTYVIGVFTPNEELEAAQNLGAIAVAGGTEDAFIVSTESNVSDELLEALNEVRADLLDCEFELVTEGEMIDFDEVWVRVFPDAGDPIWVPFVGSEAGCDPVTGGFHYDVPPNEGTPSRVVLCGATCDLLSGSEDPLVEVFTACDPTDEQGGGGAGGDAGSGGN